MKKKILLTSFQTWLPHQISNSSDDLLERLQRKELSFAALTLLRQLPVEISLASKKVITIIEQEKPDAVICCGMAESRYELTIESNANWENEQLYTSINLEMLVSKLTYTRISHDAGKFVCEGLYYQVLKYLQQSSYSSHCLFVHVPIIHSTNLDKIITDFRLILENLGKLD